MPTASSSSWDARQQKLGASFLQSSDWQIFNEALGLRTFQLHGADWSCLLIERQSRLGRYLFAPYGPTLTSARALPAALAAITEQGRQLGSRWVRIEPCLGLLIDSEFPDATLRNSGARIVSAPKQVNPRLTRMLDLAQSEDELLASISQGTRQRIRKSLRQPMLEFKTSRNPDDMATFLAMIETVSRRNQVNFHSKDYFLKQAATLMPRGSMRLELALKDGQPVACFVMHDYNQTTTYTYAGSLPEARDLNASALLMWHAIVTAKANGMTQLDLFGIAPEDADPSHPWHGFSVFKRQFGGTVVQRGPTLDLPLHPTYSLYRGALKVSRLL